MGVLIVDVNIDAETLDSKHLVQRLVAILFGKSVEKAHLPLAVGRLDGQLAQSDAQREGMVSQPGPSLVAHVDVSDRDLHVVKNFDELPVEIALFFLLCWSGSEALVHELNEVFEDLPLAVEVPRLTDDPFLPW